MKIGPFTFTRDSSLWMWGLAVSLVGAVATLDPETAAKVGIAASWLAKARLASFFIGVGSAWARTSPFPHSADTVYRGSAEQPKPDPITAYISAPSDAAGRAKQEASK